MPPCKSGITTKPSNNHKYYYQKYSSSINNQHHHDHHDEESSAAPKSESEQLDNQVARLIRQVDDKGIWWTRRKDARLWSGAWDLEEKEIDRILRNAHDMQQEELLFEPQFAAMEEANTTTITKNHKATRPSIWKGFKSMLSGVTTRVQTKRWYLETNQKDVEEIDWDNINDEDIGTCDCLPLCYHCEVVLAFC